MALPRLDENTSDDELAQLFEQVDSQRDPHPGTPNPQLKTGYFAGVGTGAERGGFDARSSNPTPYIEATAEAAYEAFAGEADSWLAGPQLAPVARRRSGKCRGNP